MWKAREPERRANSPMRLLVSPASVSVWNLLIASPPSSPETVALEGIACTLKDPWGSQCMAMLRSCWLVTWLGLG